MTSTPEQRRGQERRRLPRGGRRGADEDGLAPLVMVVGDPAPSLGLAEAVLARLRFAVATSGSVEQADRALAALRPDILVAVPADAARLRKDAPGQLAVVELTDEMRQDPELLVASIRQSLHSTDVPR